MTKTAREVETEENLIPPCSACGGKQFPWCAKRIAFVYILGLFTVPFILGIIFGIAYLVNHIEVVFK